MGLFDRFRTEPVYNTQAVVRRTGVPADTVRAWERRYGLPKPVRTAGNQRLFSERDVAVIVWLRDQTRSGLSIGRAIQLFRLEQASPQLPRDDPGSLAEGQAEGQTEGQADGRADGGGESDATATDRLGGFRDEAVEALIGFDAVRADRVIEEATALLSVEDVCLHILQPVLYEIGHRWARGEVEVSAEHFASAFVLRKLGALFNLSRPEIGRGPLVAACLEGEQHEVGLLLTCVFLSRRGFRIVYLGANLPLDDLLRTIERIRPPLVLLSASLPENAEHLADASVELQRRCRHAAQRDGYRCPSIGYGGYVFLRRPDLRSRVEGVFLGQNADDAVAAIDAVLDRSAA